MILKERDICLLNGLSWLWTGSRGGHLWPRSTRRRILFAWMCNYQLLKTVLYGIIYSVDKITIKSITDYVCM